MTASPVAAIAPPLLSPFNFVRMREVTRASVVVIDLLPEHVGTQRIARESAVGCGLNGDAVLGRNRLPAMDGLP